MFSFIYGGKSDEVTNKVLGRFAAERIFGKDNDWGPFGTIGVVEGETVIAVVVLHNWSDDHGVIEISAASDSKRWLSRRVVNHVFDICFSGHGCQLVVSRIDEGDEATLRIYRALGFRETILPRFRGRDKNEVLMMLADDEWRASRWRVTNGKEIGAEAS